jgi:hypothetical protein
MCRLQNAIAREITGLSCISAGSATFILERANSPKNEDAKLWAFGLWAGGCQAAEGTGRRRARPSPSMHLVGYKVLTLAADPGTGAASYAEACLTFFSGLSG